MSGTKHFLDISEASRFHMRAFSCPDVSPLQRYYDKEVEAAKREEEAKSGDEGEAESSASDGLNALFGSIEVGKKANLFVSDGDPFETSTNILALFIDGFNVPVDSRHLDLYQEFLNRDEGRLQPVEILPADN